MAGTWRKAPSPCIGICKRRDDGVCVGCGMTKPEKKSFKGLRSKADRKAIMRRLLVRLDALGKRARWEHVYRRRCAKKDRVCPLDKLETRA